MANELQCLRCKRVMPMRTETIDGIRTATGPARCPCGGRLTVDVRCAKCGVNRRWADDALCISCIDAALSTVSPS